MARIHNFHSGTRCPRCALPTRWCICEELRQLESPLKVDVLIHENEAEKPTNTGHLIKRVIKDSQLHVWNHREGMDPTALRAPDRELWILHPNGEEMPSDVPPGNIQVLLVDGSWKQATAMMKVMGNWGRRVRLNSITAENRFWLRTPNGPGQFSTAEALLFFYEALGLGQMSVDFRALFELHVYAVLCARGEKVKAAKYLEASPIATRMPALVAKLNHCRRDDSRPRRDEVRENGE